MSYEYGDILPIEENPLTSLISILSGPLPDIEKEVRRLIDTENPIILENLFVLIFEIRYVNGKYGNRDLFHSIFFILNEYYHELCVKVLTLIPFYGYWKDLFKIAMTDKSFLEPVMLICRAQLTLDEENINSGSISLLAKWIPKEGKSMSEFTTQFAKYLYDDTDMKHSEKMRCLRKRIAYLNRSLNTVEILECANRWNEINPRLVPKIALEKNRAAFMNEKRSECRRKFVEFFKRHTAYQNTPINYYKYIKENLSAICSAV